MSRFNNKLQGRSVTSRENENINQLLRRFKKKVEESNVLEDLRENEFYDKPSIVRKKAKASAKARWLKKLRENKLPAKLY
jgi:small subunit ribosomal protein S21